MGYISIIFSCTGTSLKKVYEQYRGAVNDLKFRVGYGMGNQDGIGPYNSINLYGEKGKLNDGQWYTSYGVTQNPNPNLKWRKHPCLISVCSQY